MKYKTYFKLIFLFVFIISLKAYGQDCKDFHRVGDCLKNVKKRYSIYGQSRSDIIGVNFTIEYNVVFYGERDYFVSFCTGKEFYPVHFKLLDATSRDLLYDNENDEYLESVGFGVEKTRQFIFQVSVLAHYASDTEMEDFYNCLGMLIQWKSSM